MTLRHVVSQARPCGTCGTTSDTRLPALGASTLTGAPVATPVRATSATDAPIIRDAVRSTDSYSGDGEYIRLAPDGVALYGRFGRLRVLQSCDGGHLRSLCSKDPGALSA